MLEILNGITKGPVTLADLVSAKVTMAIGTNVGQGGAGIIHNDVFYHHGGYSSAPRNALFSYDPLQNKITQLAVSTGTKYYHHGVGHGDNLYFFGGVQALTFLKYNIPSNTWQVLTSTNFYSQKTKGKKVGNRYYFISAKPVTGTTASPQNTVMYLDLDTLTFNELIEFPTMSFDGISNGYNGSNLTYHDGYLYIFNGNKPEIIRINIDTLVYDIFTYVAPWRHMGVPYIFDNKIFYWSGGNVNSYNETLPSLFYIDISTMTQHVVKADLHVTPYQYKQYAAHASNDDFVFAAGGFSAASTNILTMLNLKKLSKEIIYA